MATRTEIIMTCDRCEPPGNPVTGTFRLRFGSADYETELCASHKAELDTALKLVIAAARQVNRPKRDRQSDDAVMRRNARAWGIANGKPVSQRGRISRALLTEYQAANNLRA